MHLRAMVFGPAYLDRVLRVDRPLVAPALGSPVDQSVDGDLRFAGGDNLELADPSGYTIEIARPTGWPGPTGRIVLEQGICAGATGRWAVIGLSWNDDLGGMGAGYAAALGGTLCCALGPANDPISQVIARLLDRQAIAHASIRVPDHGADWTLLVSSGRHGDKLPIGFRGCHAALGPESFDHWLSTPCDLRVAAALPNRLAARILSAPGAGCRVFAPAMRNMPRSTVSRVELCRFDRPALLQPAGVGNAERPRGGGLESVDSGRDRGLLRQPGSIHDAAGRAGHCSRAGIPPRPTPARYQSRRRDIRGNLHYHVTRAAMAARLGRRRGGPRSPSHDPGLRSGRPGPRPYRFRFSRTGGCRHRPPRRQSGMKKNCCMNR